METVPHKCAVCFFCTADDRDSLCLPSLSLYLGSDKISSVDDHLPVLVIPDTDKSKDCSALTEPPLSTGEKVLS